MERRLTAILCADVYGYSRLMAQDEEATLRTLTSHRRLIDSFIAQYHGRFVNSAGDSVLAEFVSVTEATNCAVAIQHALKAENVNLPPERRMEFRIGLNLGDVMVEGEQIYGDGVNVAARLESLADPGGIYISGVVHDQVRDRLPLNFEDRGEHSVKNIPRPVRVWRVVLDGAPAMRRERRIARRYWRAGVFSVAGLAITFATILVVQHVSLRPQSTHASVPVQESAPPPIPDMPSIAVLPFANLSGERDQEYFSHGITDGLTTALDKLPGLFVIDPNSAAAYNGRLFKAPQIGRELGVRYLVEGGVQRAVNEVRVNVSLVEAADANQLWSEHFDRPLKNVFALQDDIVKKIATTLDLRVKINESGNFLGNPSLELPHDTNNVDAYDDLLRAQLSMLSFTIEGNVEARSWLRKAIALDPKYGFAYGLLAGSFFGDFTSTHDYRALEQVSMLAQKSIELADNNTCAACGYVGLSSVALFKRQPDQAIMNAKRAVELDPNLSFGYLWLSFALIASGSPDEAMGAIQKAMRLDPRHRELYLLPVNFAYQVEGRYADSIPVNRQILARFPMMAGPHFSLAIANVELGREQEARREMALGVRLDPLFWKVRSIMKDSAFEDRSGSDLVHLWFWTRQGNAQVMDSARKANESDPSDPMVHIALASSYLLDFIFWSRNPPDLERASATAQKARSLIDGDNRAGSLTDNLLSAISLWQGRQEQAIADAEHSVELDPNYPDAYETLAEALIASGKTDQGFVAIQKAIQLNPANRDAYLLTVGLCNVAAHRYAEAIPVLKQYLTRYSNLPAHELLTISYEELGRPQEAEAQAAKLLQLDPQYSVQRSFLKELPLDDRWKSDLHKAGVT